MSGEKVINTDWYRNTLAADLEESGMVETAKDICLMADTIDTLQETIESLVKQLAAKDEERRIAEEEAYAAGQLDAQ